MPKAALRALEGPDLQVWAESALRELAMARAEIDALNVYPVADRDTGTNLYLTLESAVAGLAELPEDAGAAEVLRSLAQGALLGARGNSGVILSQLLRGLATALAERSADAFAVAQALEHASEAAYAAVAQPVEGTMLTVLRAAASAAGAAAAAGADLVSVVRAAVAGAGDALARTPDQLDVLRDAGVVDAGGRGMCVLLDVLDQVVRGAVTILPPSGSSAVGNELVEVSDGSSEGQSTPRPSGPAYELMFLLDAPSDAIPGLRDALAALGEAVTVAGNRTLWTVHAHVDDVETVLAAASQVGRPHEVRVSALRVLPG